MYSRSGRDRRPGGEEIMPPKRHTSDMIPPNYGGSVFFRDRRRPDLPPDDGPRREECVDREECERCERCDEPRCSERPPVRPAPGGLQSDDILLLGLLVLLLAGGADDDIIVMLAFLLVSTMRGRP